LSVVGYGRNPERIFDQVDSDGGEDMGEDDDKGKRAVSQRIKMGRTIASGSK